MKSKSLPLIVLCMLSFLKLNAQKEGSTAPDFEVDLLSGETFKLSDHEGKVVFVFLFGNTCPFCLAAGPDIESRIYQEFKDSESFVAVGLDTWNSSSNQSSVEAFKNSTGITFPLAIKAGSVATAYETTYDRLMVIDSDRILVHKGIVASSNDIDNAKAAIEESLMVAGNSETQRSFAVRVYPNPASGRIFLNAGEGKASGFLLHDITGKRVMKLSRRDLQPGGEFSIPADHLEEGIYFYTVLRKSGGSKTGKLVIQH